MVLSTDHLPQLTLVIPIDLSRRAHQILQRAEDFLTQCDAASFKIIFGCRALNSTVYTQFEQMVQSYSHCQLAVVESDHIALSSLRNAAILQVTTPWVLFVDVDIFPDSRLFLRMLQQVQQSAYQVVMLPCLYLSAKGQRLLSKQYPTAMQWADLFYQFRRDLIQHIAFPSSVILCDMTAVRAVQGFDERYLGHGYEDFDFMLRLFAYKKIIQLDQLNFQDQTYNSPMLMQGFRCDMAAPFLQHIVDKNYAVHQYHGKHHQEDYYQLRKDNKLIFDQKFNLMAEQGHSSTMKEAINKRYLVQYFSDYCQARDIDLNEYAALFDPMPGHMWRQYSMWDHIRRWWGKNKL